MLSTSVIYDLNLYTMYKFNLSLNFMRTGYYSYRGYINNRTRYGYWWSTTSLSATNGRSLYTHPGNVYPQYNSYRGNGFAIRCTIRVE